MNSGPLIERTNMSEDLKGLLTADEARQIMRGNRVMESLRRYHAQILNAVSNGNCSTDVTWYRSKIFNKRVFDKVAAHLRTLGYSVKVKWDTQEYIEFTISWDEEPKE
jgi:hypothetical protein